MKAIHDTTITYSKLIWADSINETLKRQDESLHTINETIARSIHSDNKFLNMFSYDTVFTVFVTIFIFIIGIIIDRLLKYCDKKNREKELIAYFKIYLTRIAEKTSLKLIELYRKYYRTTNIDSGIPLTAPKILTGDFQRIRNITDKELHRSIYKNLPKSKEKVEVLPKILNCIDFIAGDFKAALPFISNLRLTSLIDASRANTVTGISSSSLNANTLGAVN